MQPNHDFFVSGTFFLARKSAMLAVGLFLAIAANSVSAADTNVSAPVSSPAKTMSRTVGLDIVKKTANSNGTTSLTFRWDEKGKQMERTVVVNDKTIVVYNGQLKKFADLTDEQM